MLYVYGNNRHLFWRSYETHKQSKKENAMPLLSDLMLRLQSNEFAGSNKLPPWKIFVNAMFQLAEKFCTVLGTQKILNLYAVLQIRSLSRVACIQSIPPGAIPFLSFSINFPPTSWFTTWNSPLSWADYVVCTFFISACKPRIFLSHHYFGSLVTSGGTGIAHSV